MKIGIDGVVLRGRDAGTLRYVEQLLSGLAEIDTSNQYVVFADRQSLSPGAIPYRKNLLYQYIRSDWLPPALRQQMFRAWHAQGTLDLLHSPVFIPPLLFKGKTVMTVHDLAFVRYPQTKKWTGRLWWQFLGRRGIEKANQIIAVSESTRRDLVGWGIAQDKVSVVYPCTRAIFKPAADRRAIAAQYRLPEHYVLYVGTLERRKNIANLIRAFALAKRTRGLPHALVLAGQRGWLYEDIFQTVAELGLKDQVAFLGYVPDEHLPGLYSGADLFAYLSWYEGFGLPVLEAMACGIPVLTSNSSSLPEVTGDAGVMVPPDDVEQAASEMIRILTDRDLRDTMIERSLRRGAQFSQARLARETLAVYDNAIRGAR